MDEPTNPKNNRAMAPHKVFDVAKPGKSVPSQNARPVILTHSALPHDPMVSTEDKNSMGETVGEEIVEIYDDVEEIKTRSTKSTIEPIKAEEPADADTQVDVEVVTKEPEHKLVVDQDNSSDEPNESTPTKTVKHTGLVVEPVGEAEKSAPKPVETEDEIDEINEFAGQAAAKSAKKIEDEAELKRVQAAQELIDSKKYFVPISKRRAHNRVIWGVVFLVLLAAASAAGYWYLTQ